MADNKKPVDKKTNLAYDDEMYKHLDVLLNMDELEESDFWDEMMNLGELESDKTDAAKGSHN